MDDEQAGRRQQFLGGIAAGLAYFQALAAQGDEAMDTLDAERHNLHQVVQYGLAFPETWPATATLIDQTFPLIERRGYWPEWIPIVCRALSLSPSSAPREKVLLLNRLGQLYFLSRQLKEAITKHQEAEALAVELGDEQLVAKAHFHLMGDYLLNKQYTEAEHHGQQALPELRQSNSETRLLAATLKILGQTSRELGDLKVAEARTKESVSIWRTIGDPTELARSLNDLANVYLADEKFEQAAQSYGEAINILHSSENELDKAMLCINLGALYYRLEQWLEAETTFRRADSPYLRRSPQYTYQAMVASGLGNVLLEQGRFAEAILYLDEAIRLWHIVGEPIYLANTLGAMGEANALEGQTAKALSWYNEALALLYRYPSSDWARRFIKRIEAKRKQLLAKE